jgi:hypothetical protein
MALGQLIHPWRAKLNYFRRFRFQGKSYRYCMHSYNESWDNERTVEVPIFERLIKEVRERGGQVLEVGNVLANYGAVTWPVVDKYERGPHVTTIDVMDIHFSVRYDLIFAISTFEHIGFDEMARKFPESWDKGKVGCVIKKLVQEGLKLGGKLMVSVPIGYNPGLDEMIFSGALGCQSSYYIKRMSWSNRWREVDAGKVQGVKYNQPYYCGNAVCIAEFSG